MRRAEGMPDGNRVGWWLATAIGPRPTEEEIARHAAARGDQAGAELRERLAREDFQMPDPATGEVRSARELMAEADAAAAEAEALAEILRAGAAQMERADDER